MLCQDGMRTSGQLMVGADEPTEQFRSSTNSVFCTVSKTNNKTQVLFSFWAELVLLSPSLTVAVKASVCFLKRFQAATLQ